MPRLMLLRHAKSSWDDDRAEDFERPLNTRGRRAAPLMGRHMATHQLQPQRIVCSSARRTRETLAGLLPYLDEDMELRLTRDLYETSEDRYLDVLRAQGGASRNLLLIGHNPALQDLALTLIGQGNPSLTDDIREKFPTAALAVIDFEARRWVDVEPKSGRIVAFFRPRELAMVDAGAEDDDE
ncbi:SixA phosphatase family protein [Prosthecodimorpha staleyi]|uniref:Histidine phosphatase family protein n=1 Tax=Prosthecodimorpha staleyi TaxID=2840188 RepID=A0A947D5M9_9HYPH|nr:histidine phosphatase family protein [Prosthecodimorpha staleyi]MBT9290619.1 histidine phosphatase family protein [Prosthecodimorpha staleyi]